MYIPKLNLIAAFVKDGNGISNLCIINIGNFEIKLKRIVLFLKPVEVFISLAFILKQFFLLINYITQPQNSVIQTSSCFVILCLKKTMTHTYNINGMTCTGCQANVQKLLSGIAGIQNVSIDLSKGEATIDMTSHILTSQLKSALKDYPKYQLEEKQVLYNVPHLYREEETKSWFITYKPILVIFAYITGVTVLLEIVRGNFNGEIWMQNFMAGFFLVFSFFKLLDLQGFADGYSIPTILSPQNGKVDFMCMLLLSWA